jgi:hypothetical protein
MATEIRCPRHPGRLLLKIAKVVQVDGANLIEVACRDCRKDARDAGRTPALVLHRYNVLGTLVETVEE